MRRSRGLTQTPFPPLQGNRLLALLPVRAIIQTLARLTISPDDAGQRLDRFLRKVLPGVSLGQIYRAVRRADARVNGVRVAVAHRLQLGDVVELGPALGFVTASSPLVAVNPDGTAPVPDVVYRDDDLLVVDKPAALAVHPGTGIREHLVGRVHAWLGQGRGHSFRIAPAHRLDRDTSGLVVFGLSARGLRGFTESLRTGGVTKTYLALVHGTAPEQGEICLALLREVDRPVGARMRVAASGVEALTRFRRLGQRGERSLLAVELVTGRTHQIRAHLAALGHAIVGDRRYGKVDGEARLHLHAWRLCCAHPITGARMDLEAPPPAALRP